MLKKKLVEKVEGMATVPSDRGMAKVEVGEVAKSWRHVCQWTRLSSLGKLELARACAPPQVPTWLPTRVRYIIAQGRWPFVSSRPGVGVQANSRAHLVSSPGPTYPATWNRLFNPKTKIPKPSTVSLNPVEFVFGPNSNLELLVVLWTWEKKNCHSAIFSLSANPVGGGGPFSGKQKGGQRGGGGSRERTR